VKRASSAASIVAVALLLAAFTAFTAFTPTAPSLAFAGETPATAPACPELPCSVNRNCSSTGVACLPDDRVCMENARADNLEVKCEQQCTSNKWLVYCPPDTGRSDSKIVWILLSFAVALATGGTTLAWVILKKKA
jgi:hypothetical protein